METAKVTPGTAEAPEPNTPWIQLGVLGGDTHRLDFQTGMTIQQALDASQVQLQRGSFVTLNGEPATPETVLEANSVVMVTGRVRNG